MPARESTDTMTTKSQHPELHPLCTFFPRLEGAEFEALRADIQANGLRQPIVLHQGLILDGGNRFRACVEAGVRPRFVEFSGEGGLAAFVLSANLHRRHMTPGQRAAIVASARDWEQAQSVGRPEKSAPGSTVPPDTTRARALQADASVSTQRRADAVARAAPELAHQVAQGKTTLGEAVRQAAPQLAPRPPDPPPAPPAQPAPVEPPAKAKAPSPDPAARIAELEAQVANLQAELNEARDAAADLADQVESYDKATAGEVAAAKEMTRLKQQVRVVESQRDQHMTTCNELRRQVKMLQRQLAKMERAA
jgi:hypothetical protein